MSSYCNCSFKCLFLWQPWCGTIMWYSVTSSGGFSLSSCLAFSWLLVFIFYFPCTCFLYFPWRLRLSDLTKGRTYCSRFVCVCILVLLHPSSVKAVEKTQGFYFTSERPGPCEWVLKLEIVTCQAPATSLCEWVNWQGHWDRIGRGNMWEGEGQIELEDVHSSWLALCHMAVAMTMQQLS